MMTKNKLVRGSRATRKNKDGEPICDLVELANLYSSNVGHVPEKLSYAAACEISLLARTFLFLWKDRDKNKWRAT